MSKQRDREDFIVRMAKEGMGIESARALLDYGGSLQRIAERECSDESADRDRVNCPGVKNEKHCICEHWSGCGCKDQAHPDTHHPVTRIAARGANIERKVAALLEEANAAKYKGRDWRAEELPAFAPVFNGDPRGAVLKIRVPSGYSDSWGGEGVCVP